MLFPAALAISGVVFLQPGILFIVKFSDKKELSEMCLCGWGNYLLQRGRVVPGRPLH